MANHQTQQGVVIISVCGSARWERRFSTLALRANYKLDDHWLVRAVILDGVPGNPERPVRTAVKLSAEDGALGAVELNYASDSTRIGLGYWRYTGAFETFQSTPRAADMMTAYMRSWNAV
jgi:hypothetical protein